MLTKIAAWLRNPALQFREQTWVQKRENLEFLKSKHDKWFAELSPQEQEKIVDAFMNLQRGRLWVVRNVLWALFGLIALLFLR